MTPNEPKQADAAIVRDLATQSALEHIEALDGTSSVVIRNAPGCTHAIVDLEKQLSNPRRIREKLSFHEPESFIWYFELFKGDGTALFFDSDKKSFKAVFDYSVPAAVPGPCWGDHVATYDLRKSEEWAAWEAKNGAGAAMTQVAFGQFIEERIDDIIVPDGGSLLDLVMNFEATKSAQFKSAQRLKDGTVRFQYTEDMTTNDLVVPDTITIKVPVFQGQIPKEIKLRFRYRIDEGKLKLHYEIARIQRVLNDAAQEVVSQVRTAPAAPS